MSDSELVTCDAHGETPCTFACQHLTRGVACGYHASVANPADKWPDAWCDVCEEAVQATGGEWNEESEKVADIKIVCTYCYEAARSRNIQPPLHTRGKRTRLSAKEVATLLHHATQERQGAQAASDKRWGWNGLAKWNFGRRGEHADVLGPGAFQSHRRRSTRGELLDEVEHLPMAWETFDEDAVEAHEISQLRVFGEVRGIRKLTTANWK